MRRLLAAVLTTLALATAALAQSPPFPTSMPPHTVVANPRPIAAAGQAVTFSALASALGSSGAVSPLSDYYFGSGRPWCDPRSQGAKGDGATDDTAAFNACLTNLSAIGGGILYVPPGTYCLFSGITTTGPVYIKGAVTSFLSACAHDVTVLTMQNANSLVDGIVVLGNNSVTATGDAIHLTSACVRCTIANSIAEFGRYGILIDAVDHVLYNVDVAATYGTAMVRTNAGGFHYRTKLDSSWPGAQPTAGSLAAPSAWQSTHSYSTNAVVTQGGFYLQATTGGTSGSSFPGLQPYGTAIVDSGVVWKIIVPTTYYLLQVDGGTTSLVTHGGDYSGPATAGVGLVNTNAGTGPESIVIDAGTFGGNITQAVLANAGNDLRVVNSPNIASCAVTTCSGINFAGSWSGDALVQGNTFLNLPTAVNYGVGNGLRVIGNGMFGSVASAVGVSVAANLNNFTIQNTNFNSPIWGSVTTGVSIAAGTSNHYRIGGLICTGTSTCVSDAGTGTDKQVEASGTMTGAYTWSTSTNSVIFGGGSGSYDFIHGGTNSFDLFQNSTFAGNGVQIGQLSTGHAFITNIDNQPIDFSTNNTARWHIGATGGLYSDGITGTDKGAGTLNLATLYLTNVQAATTIGTTAVNLGSSATAFAGLTALTGASGGMTITGGTGITDKLTMTATTGAGAGSEGFRFLAGSNGAAIAGIIQNSSAFTGSLKGANYTGAFGTLCIGTFNGAPTTAFMGNCQDDQTTGTNYRFLAGASGATIFNAPSSQVVLFDIANVEMMRLQTGGGLSLGTTTDPGAGAFLANAAILSQGATGGVGYRTGAGGTITQTSTRSSTVILNKVTGAITLVSAAGSTTPTTFTVTNSTVAATDTIHVVQASGTDKYEIFVTNVTSSAFNITFFTTGGTTTEQPVFNFTVMKGVTS